MFFKKAKNEPVRIYNPLHAEVIPLEKVPDPVFSEKMMGDGFGFIPSCGEVLSPINGKVTQVFPTKHAIGLVTDEGIEVLLHLGLETVELNGEGFSITTSVGDKVRAGTSLGSIDLSFIKEKGKETTSVLVFPSFKGNVVSLRDGQVEAGTPIAELTLNK